MTEFPGRNFFLLAFTKCLLHQVDINCVEELNFG